MKYNESSGILLGLTAILFFCSFFVFFTGCKEDCCSGFSFYQEEAFISTEEWVPRYREIQFGMNRTQVEKVLGESKIKELDNSFCYGDCPTISLQESPYTGHCIQVWYSKTGKVYKKEFFPDGQLHVKDHRDKYRFHEPVCGDLQELINKEKLSFVNRKKTTKATRDVSLCVIMITNRGKWIIPKIVISTDSASGEVLDLEPDCSARISIPIESADFRVNEFTGKRYLVLKLDQLDDKGACAQTRSYWVPCSFLPIKIDAFFEINFGFAPKRCIIEG